MLWTAAGLGVASAVGGLAWAVRGRASQVFGESIYHGPRDRKALALTFDDGPSEGTPLILDLLRRHSLRATFFMCGQNVKRLPEIARQVAAAGHEIGNHTHTHPRFDFQSSDFIYRELAEAQEAIHTATGATPHWFRAPYGVRWFGLSEAQRKLGLKGALWTTIARDWKLSAEEVAARLVGSNGAILCLHDGRELRANPNISPTVRALEIALPHLLEWKLETLSEAGGRDSSRAGL